ncbi:unnamed protein product [Closterium sp. Naga37s-1]|nr:unnamed protein product [Closterium sp. Naga37s-1]
MRIPATDQSPLFQLSAMLPPSSPLSPSHPHSPSSSPSSPSPFPSSSVNPPPSASPSPFWRMPLSPSRVYLIDSPASFRAARVDVILSKAIMQQTYSLQSMDSWQQADRWQGADGWEEVVLLLDLLSLPPCLYAPPLRAMLRAPHTLKLGFAFSDDLEFLHQSLPLYHRSLSSHHHSLPPHHHSLPSHHQSPLPPSCHEHPSLDCFHHVSPFIDVGAAYHAIRRARLHLKRDNLLSLLTTTAPPGSLASRSVLPPASGLSALAQVLLGAPLDKELQCSDWEQRPLSRHQLHYAAADALCLIHMALALLPLALRPHALSAHALSANGKGQVGLAAVHGGPSTSPSLKLIEWAEREGRVLLTRDVKLFQRRLLPPTHMHLIRSTDKREQLREVQRRIAWRQICTKEATKDPLKEVTKSSINAPLKHLPRRR